MPATNGVHKSPTTDRTFRKDNMRQSLIQELKGQLRVDFEADLKERLLAHYQQQVLDEVYKDVRSDVLTQLEHEIKTKSEADETSLGPTRSIFTPICHPQVEQATADVDGYYLKYWPFPNEAARKKFVAAGFPRVTSLYFPKALDSRIRYACSLLTILFLIDDQLEEMSFADGKAYNESFMPLMRGDVEPDRSVPAQWMMYDLWEDMRRCDREVADSVLEPTFKFMRAQTDQKRLTIRGLGEYLTYRQADVGQALLAALGRFSMGLHLTEEDLDSITTIEENTGRHIAVINDIFSYEKELRTSKTAHAEGGYLCSAIPIFADEAHVPIPAAKQSLYQLCRSWEYTHKALVTEREKSESPCSSDLKKYMEGLEYHMSGNELWSQTTKRYAEVS